MYSVTNKFEIKSIYLCPRCYIYFYIHIQFMKVYVDQFDTAYKIIKNIRCNISYEESGSKNHSVVSDSLWPHGLYSSWNSSGQNTEVGSCSLLQGIFPTQGSNLGQVFCIAGGVFTIIFFSYISLHWSLKKAFLSLLAILWSSAFKWAYLSFSPLRFTSFLFPAICEASLDNHFAFWQFSWSEPVR